MKETYLGYPIVWMPINRVFYNDDTLYHAAGSLIKEESGWWSPSGHPNSKYLHQTGTILRSTHGYNYSASDHFRSSLLYKNLKASIERDGLQAPLVAIEWHNPSSFNWSIPMAFPVWEEFWNKMPAGEYWRTIQGGSRLFVLKDLKWEKVPIIDITEESIEVLDEGKCPSKKWVYSEKGRASREAASHVGFKWDKAHSENLFA